MGCLTGHTDAVQAMAFSPDGATLATGGDDRAVRLWNARTGRLVATFTGHTEAVTAVVFSPDGATLATASFDWTARLWNGVLSPAKQTQKICSAVGRSLTEEEWSQYLPNQPYQQICQD